MDTLFTVVGTGNYKPMVYVLDGRKSEEVRYAPLALLQLVKWSQEKVRVRAFLTQKANEIHGEPLAEEVKRLGHEFTRVDIPEGRSEEEIWKIFRIVSENLTEVKRPVLDITHGFRSLQFVVLGAVLFLKEKRGMEPGGIYYGALEAQDPTAGTEPVFDLTPLLDMVEWAHAVKIFKKYGHADEIGALLSRIHHKAYSRTGGAPKPRLLQTLGNCLRQLSMSLAEGLPLEVGKAAWGLLSIKQEQQMMRELSGFAIPGEMVVPSILESFQDKALKEVEKRGEWKAKVTLDLEELGREALLVDWYLEQGQVGMALGVMREWMVNRVILAMGFQKHWLDYGKARKRAERRLNLLTEMQKNYEGLLTQNQVQIGRWWQQVAEKRNAIHHCGFSRSEVRIADMENLRDVWEQIKEKAKIEDFWDVKRPVSTEKVLLTPLGLSKGLLFSALKQVQPSKLVFVTSREAEGTIPEILEKAGVIEVDKEVMVMKDP
ncbi:MAG: TM1812 family CRISPR-associated protein, partial [Thermodesulfobacteriota bacterium]